MSPETYTQFGHTTHSTIMVITHREPVAEAQSFVKKFEVVKLNIARREGVHHVHVAAVDVVRLVLTSSLRFLPHAAICLVEERAG